MKQIGTRIALFLLANPNQFFVFRLAEADLGGSKLVPQEFRSQFPW